MLYYDEVFESIQGESSYQGIPSVFVRLYGCNLSCSYCDQPQCRSDKKRISENNILAMIRSFNLRYICITGGEPLIQDDVYPLIYALVKDGYEVSIETNGCVPIELDSYSRTFKYVMDVKCPSSGVSNKNILTNLTNLKSNDEVKFVIADRKDYDFAKGVLRKYPTVASLIFSPMFNADGSQTVGTELSKWLLEDKLYKSRLGVQIHKILSLK